MHKLKIAQIAPIAERVPPKRYGGIERVVDVLTRGLVKKGHDVTLFASGDSKTPAKLVSVYPRGLREAKIKDPYALDQWVLLHVLNAYHRQAEFDIIHDHNSIFSLPTTELSTTPNVVTIHGSITTNNRRLFESTRNINYVTISKAQIDPIPDLRVMGNVYNGLNMENYPFSIKHKGYLLFVGRICMEKGTHHAIDVATDLNLPLIIAAKLDDKDKQYFYEYVEPRLYDEQVKWVGEVDEKERNRLMSGAMALLYPVTWREPFGLTMIEAMACGCPVIAFNRGSIPEVLVDGKTGFIVNDVEEMIEAVGRINKIDRKEARSHALKNFSGKKMTDDYEKIYYEILGKK